MVIKALRILQWVLLCVQVSRDVEQQMSWWTALLPVWLLAGYALARAVARLLRMGSQVDEVELQLSFPGVCDGVQAHAADALSGVLGEVCCGVCWCAVALAAILAADCRQKAAR